MKKIFFILAFILLACTGCGIGSGENNADVTFLPGISAAPEPAVSASVATEPSVSATVTTEPEAGAVVTPESEASVTAKSKPSAAVQSSPEDTLQHHVNEDIPAYLTAGLQKLGEMAPGWERFYYLSYYNTVEDYSTPGTFNEKRSADLDGDGKEESITIIGGKPYDGVADVDPSFSDITIDIDGNKLKLKSETISQVALPFTLEGRILDVDKNDGKKEILIEASIMIGPTLDYIITYDDNVPRIIFKYELDNRFYLFGMGYITTPERYDTAYPGGISYYKLWKMKSDRSGFEPAGNKYYPTLSQFFCWEDGKWDESKAAPTQRDEYLYKEPGGNEKVQIKQGTPVFIGLYAKQSWLMILDAKGELLGWLDADKVDYNEYTNHAFEPEGD